MTLETPEARDFIAADDGEAFVTSIQSELDALARELEAAEAEADQAERWLAAIAEDDAVSTASIATMQRAVDDLVATTKQEGDARIERARVWSAESIAAATVAAAALRAEIAPVAVPPPPVATPRAHATPGPVVAPPARDDAEMASAIDRAPRDVTSALLPAIALVIVLIVAVAWIG